MQFIGEKRDIGTQIKTFINRKAILTFEEHSVKNLLKYSILPESEEIEVQ